MALELWSGFHLENKVYIQQFVNALGPCPEYRPNPNVGRTNMFIGMMIRFEVLARLGRSEQLIRELKDVYLQELRDGSGTLFENVHALSGCHAFNGEAGALIVNQVLGLGQPLQLTKTVTICPHPARLRWAVGTAETRTEPFSWTGAANRMSIGWSSGFSFRRGGNMSFSGPLSWRAGRLK